MVLQVQDLVDRMSIGGDIALTKSYFMFSASAVAESAERQYEVVKGKSGRRWLYSAAAKDIPDQASHIYVEGGPGSQGFGGRTISFQLLSGEKLDLVGPWTSNADALFKDTGVDLRNKHLTWGFVAKHRVYEKDNHGTLVPVFKCILHYDLVPQTGTFNRITDHAKTFSELTKRRVAYYSQSFGGSRHGYANFGKYPEFE
jgi:hypothetical protein